MNIQNTQNEILLTNKTLKNFLKEFDVDATDYGIEIWQGTEPKGASDIHTTLQQVGEIGAKWGLEQAAGIAYKQLSEQFKELSTGSKRVSGNEEPFKSSHDPDG